VRAEPGVKVAAAGSSGVAVVEMGKERVRRRDSSVARTEGRACSKEASSRIRARMVGTSGGGG
jgi:hypothetical protein